MFDVLFQKHVIVSLKKFEMFKFFCYAKREKHQKGVGGVERSYRPLPHHTVMLLVKRNEIVLKNMRPERFWVFHNISFIKKKMEH